MRKLIVLLLTLVATVETWSQNQPGTWTVYPSLTSLSYCGSALDGQYYAFSSEGLLIYDARTYETYVLDKLSALSESNISAVHYSGGSYYVGYESGNIDIIDAQTYEVTSIPEIKTTTNITAKTVNAFCRIGNRVFCATGSGLFEIDQRKSELKSFYRIAQGATIIVNDILIFNSNIYLATSQGVYMAPLSSSLLEDVNSWSSLPDFIGQNVWRLRAHGQMLVAGTGERNANSSVYVIGKDGSGELFRQFDKLTGFDVNNDRLAVSLNDSISCYDLAENTLSSSIKQYAYSSDGQTSYSAPIAMDVAFDDANRLIVADAHVGSDGIYLTDLSGRGVRAYVNSPVNSLCVAMKVVNGSLYVAGGKLSSMLVSMYYGRWLKVLENGRWHNAGFSGPDCFDMAVNSDASKMFVSVYMTGLYEVKEKRFGTLYNGSNVQYFQPTWGDVYCTTGVGFDYDDNLYVGQFVVPDYPIVVLSADSEWGALRYKGFTENNGLCQVRRFCPTRNGNMWCVVPRCDRAGLAVFNVNGTPLDDTDDKYRTAIATNDPRDCGALTLIDADGELLAPKTNYIVEDKDGILWIATPNGPIIFEGNETVFSTPKPVFKKIKVPRNDGTDLADYLLDGVDVSCIVVDGANRKWLGTVSNGVYLVSPNGYETVEHFTMANSPLPSNEVLDMAIDEKSGCLYIATTQGLVSYVTSSVEPVEDMDRAKLKIYPNPVLEQHSQVVMDGFAYDSDVRITDAQGRLVYRTTSMGGRAIWNVTEFNGPRVVSGVYLVWAQTSDGKQTTVGKVVVVN